MTSVPGIDVESGDEGPTMPDLLDILTDDGRLTGRTATRAEIHRRGLPHRAIHVYILNEAHELLVQRRGQVVDHLPGVLTISVAGHVDAAESSEAAAYRELAEELGVVAPAGSLKFAFTTYSEATLNDGAYIDRQFNDVFVLRLDREAERFAVDRHEVTSVEWMPVETFAAMAAAGVEGIPAVYAIEAARVAAILRNY